MRLRQKSMRWLSGGRNPSAAKRLERAESYWEQGRMACLIASGCPQCSPFFFSSLFFFSVIFLSRCFSCRFILWHASNFIFNRGSSYHGLLCTSSSLRLLVSSSCSFCCCVVIFLFFSCFHCRFILWHASDFIFNRGSSSHGLLDALPAGSSCEWGS